MKILLLSDRIPPEGRGGAEAVVWRLAQGLAAAGHETHVAASTPGAPFEELRDGIPTYHLRAKYPERFRAWLSLWNPQTAGPARRLIERLQPDIVNAHNIHACLSYHALKLAHAAGCGVVFSAHDAMPIVYGKLPASLGSRDFRLPAAYNLRMNRFRYNPCRNVDHPPPSGASRAYPHRAEPSPGCRLRRQRHAAARSCPQRHRPGRLAVAG